MVYCNPSDVSRVVGAMMSGKRMSFESDSTPTENEVEKMIEGAEARINRITSNSFGSIAVVNEYHNCEVRNRAVFYHRNHMTWKLNSYPTLPFDTEKGDKIEVWYNDAWINLVADKTEGLAVGDEDWWVDIADGMVYLHTTFPEFGHRKIRFSYRHGRALVPADIREATAMMCSVAILLQYGNDPIRTEGEKTPNVENQIKLWKEEIKDILDTWSQKAFKSFLS
jgi:hypothetical protein